jgi:8-oxo-dGTP pyrophosphatase MutT (NUDIX family)
MDIRKGVLLLIKNKDNKYLLLQHTRDEKWGFVSGGIEVEDIDDIATIIRESEEEVGFKPEADKIHDIGITMEFETPKYKGEYKWYEYISENNLTIQLQRLEEIKAFGWFTEEETLQRIEDKAVLVETFHNYLHNVQ